MRFKSYILSEGLFGDKFEFGDAADFEKYKNRKEVSRVSKTENITIKCWRGTSKENFDKQVIDKGSNYFVLDGSKSYEKGLWFTHELQRGYVDDPEQFATNYAKDFLIEYPLSVKKHYDIVTYDDGKTSNEAPKDSDQIIETELSNKLYQYNAVYELPDGWFFTWQIQKHLLCTKPLMIQSNMIKEIKREQND